MGSSIENGKFNTFRRVKIILEVNKTTHEYTFLIRLFKILLGLIFPRGL